MNPRDLGYELTVKEIDNNTRYEVLEIAGLSGLGIDKVKSLVENGVLPTDSENRVRGQDFLFWVRENDLPVRN